MRIDNTGPLGGARATKKTSKSTNGSAEFSVSDGEETSTASHAANLSSVSNLDALLSLQAVDNPLDGKRHSAERGLDMLDRLEELKLGLLDGRLSGTQVTRLTQKIKALSGLETGDNELDQILSDIDLRARVELAKLGVFDI